MSKIIAPSNTDGAKFEGSTRNLASNLAAGVTSLATTVADGLMSSDDKTKLDALGAGADITGVAITAGTGLSGSVTTTSGDHTQTLTHAAHTGDVTGAAALTIADDAVTYAKMQNVSADERILGRVSGADGVVEELTKAQTLTMLNVADGATANDTDSNLKARANHTGTQAASTISDFDTEVANNSAVTANTAKVTNVSTDLSVTANGTSLTVNSSDGTNASLPLADTNNWGVMSDEMFDEHTANTAKVTNVTTNLSVSRDGTKLDVVSSDGTNAVLPLADTDNWGVMSDEMFDKLDGIEAGADVTDTTNVTAAGALMDSEVDADIKTLSLPASTTISDFGKTLIDDADAAAALTTLGVTSNATHTGQVTGATVLTVAAPAITEQTEKTASAHNDDYIMLIDSEASNALKKIKVSRLPAGGGGSGHTIQEEGSDLASETYLNFVGELVEATDDSGNSATDITIDAKTAWLYG